MLLFLDELKFYSKDLWNFEIGWVSSYIKPGLHPVQPTTIEVNCDEMNQFIFGIDDKKTNFQEKASEILRNLGFKVEWNQVTVPLWRWPDDINIPADVAEEVARIYGYNNIKPTLLQNVTQTVGGKNKEQKTEDKIREAKQESYRKELLLF